MTLPIKELEDEEFIESIASALDINNYTWLDVEGKDNTYTRYALFTTIWLLLTIPPLIMLYNLVHI
jgi:hypothetical protein